MIKLYGGYYEMFITNKDMPKPMVLMSTFDTVDEALSHANELHEDDKAYIDDEIVQNAECYEFWKAMKCLDDKTFNYSEYIEQL